MADALQERLPGPVAAVVRRLRSEDVSLLSAGLSFYALVSVVPFAVVVLWLVSLITGKARVHEVAEQLARHLPAKLGVDNALQRVADLGVGLGVGALAALIWPASAYGAGLRRSFARLADDKDEDVKGLRGRGLALGLVGVVPALALTGLFAAYLGTAVVGDGGQPWSGGGCWPWLSASLPALRAWLSSTDYSRRSPWAGGASPGGRRRPAEQSRWSPWRTSSS